MIWITVSFGFGRENFLCHSCEEETEDSVRGGSILNIWANYCRVHQTPRHLLPALVMYGTYMLCCRHFYTKKQNNHSQSHRHDRRPPPLPPFILNHFLPHNTTLGIYTNNSNGGSEGLRLANICSPRTDGMRSKGCGVKVNRGLNPKRLGKKIKKTMRLYVWLYI